MTFLIKTFFREDKLFRLIDSIRANFKDFKIVIADDSLLTDAKTAVYNQLSAEGHKILLLPFDSGLSYGRNQLLENSEGVFVMCDDDFVFTEDNGVLEATELLAKADIVTGNLYTGRAFTANNYKLKVKHNAAHKIATESDEIDMGINFFVSDNHDMRWDEKIKINHEHLDFFLSNELDVRYCPALKVKHDTSSSGDEYKAYRDRQDDYFFDKWNIDEIIEGDIIIRRNNDCVSDDSERR